MVTENPSGKSPTVTATDLVSLLMLVSFRLTLALSVRSLRYATSLTPLASQTERDEHPKE